ncbi:hypothetical protein [Oerskovia jenensis]|uniref:hypothetical protein n=1 Tax=Oerskovia jenensis TaxID=162169 RepID=UPI0036DA7F37
MREFLIRTSADHGWPAFHRDRMAEVLQPVGWDSAPVGRPGDFRVRAEGVEVSYSGEEIGWQVTFDGDMSRAEEWIEQVTQQIAVAVGEPCEWLELS